MLRKFGGGAPWRSAIEAVSWVQPIINIPMMRGPSRLRYAAMNPEFFAPPDIPPHAIDHCRTAGHALSR